MKDFIRVGNHFLNPTSIADVEFIPGDPPKAKIYSPCGGGVPAAHTLEGDEAEEVLKQVGYGKSVRDKEKHDAEEAVKKAAHEKEQAEKKAAHEAEQAEKATHAKHAKA